jgi:hypothetical protein
MSELDKVKPDVLNTLAKLQEKPPRSARDLAVLEAARAKATLNRQVASAPVKEASSFLRFLSKPMWLGTGSLAAAALSVFIVFGHQAEQPQQMKKDGPVLAQAPTVNVEVAKAEVPKVETPKVEAKKAITAAVSEPVRNRSKETRESKQSTQQDVVAKVETAQMVAEKAVPDAAVQPSQVAAASLPPAAAPMATAPMATAPMAAARAPEGLARKRDLSSGLGASESCLIEMKAVPVDKQTLNIEATRLLLERCAQSFPRNQWPSEIEWAKKLLDNRQEKSQ